MSGKTSSRHVPSPSSPPHSKLPKFLQKQSTRDRSKSVNDGALSSSSGSSSSNPVVVEPPPTMPVQRSNSRSRLSSEMSSASPSLPTRLSGWFSHTFNTSSTDLSLPTILAQSPSRGLVGVAKHGKGHLDKAVRYILDTDSTPDKCMDPIWLLGVQHPGSESDGWPPEFYDDFTSRIWLTYRNGFSIPIRDPPDPNASTSSRKWWGGNKEWSSDSGWGCMLRTGQSLLANALIHVHLGRNWRRPQSPEHTAAFATYVEILTWFLDTPGPEAPFSVHRMALAGKDLGTEVGQWFGPSIAAGALKTLVRAFPNAGIGVSVGTDGQLFQTDVFVASGGDTRKWGDRPVLLLLGIRLGLNGVNPIYYDSIKTLYTWPQSVGIAGGRPSSSYYFVGSQADNLFYLDPHHARPAIPVRIPGGSEGSNSRQGSTSSKRSKKDKEKDRERASSPTSSSFSTAASDSETSEKRRSHSKRPTQPTSPASAFSVRSSASAPMSPSPLSLSSPPSMSPRSSSNSYTYVHATISEADLLPPKSSSAFVNHSSAPSSPQERLSPQQTHLVLSYPMSDLKTFHCDRVRKMPLSGLDPSMLLGFLCEDEDSWKDFRRRVGELPRSIFSVQDEPPRWPSSDSDDVGLESITMSDPDLDFDDDDDDGDADEEHRRSSSWSASARGSTSTSASNRNSVASSTSASVNDTEDDPVDPITPGPNSKFDFRSTDAGKGKGKATFEEEADIEKEQREIDDDWVEASPSPSPSPHPPPRMQQPVTAVPPPKLTPPPKAKTKRKKEREQQKPVPVPQVKLPPNQHFAFPVMEGNGGDGGVSARMHNARARDGGRTQSGGVKGILTED